MASKVNVKFVVTLGAALGLVLAAMAGVFYFVLKKSGEDWATRGDQLAAESNWEDADTAYSFAVAHDRTRVEWLRKWRDAMEHVVPENQIDFDSRFNKDYVGTTRQIAQMSRTADLEAHTNYLDLQLERFSGATSPDVWRFLLSEAKASLGFFENPTARPVVGQTPVEDWHRLYKYTGTALSVLYGLNQTQTADEVDEAENDLRLAIEADPGDTQTVLELSQLYAVKAERLRTAAPVDLAGSERAQRMSREVLTSALERDPQNIDAAIGLLQLDANALVRDTMARTGGVSPTPAQSQALLAPLVARLDQIHQTVMARAGDGTLDRLTILRYRGLERIVDPVGREHRSREALEAALAKRPDNVSLLLIEAQSLGASGNEQQGVATLQRLIDLPNPPLGLDGSLLWNIRESARELQAEFTLARIEPGVSAEQRNALLAEAQGYRDELAKFVAGDSVSLLRLDAHIAFVRQDWGNAERMLLRLDERSGGLDDDASWWMAQTAIALNKAGVAKEVLDRLNESRPDSPNVMRALAAVEWDLRNRDRAGALVRRLQELLPDDPGVKDLVHLVLEGGDPVQAALIRYDNTAQGLSGALPDPEGALAGLQQDFEKNGFDLGLGVALMQRYLGRKDVASALHVCDQVLAAHPDNADFRRFQEALKQGDLGTALLDMINSGPADDFNKAIARWQVLQGLGRPDEAAAELARAATIKPDDPTVIEGQFLTAIGKGDAGGVHRAAEHARQVNVDSLNGDTFKFREQAYNNQFREAVTTLESLVVRAPNDGTLWRYLGLYRIQVGRTSEAVDAYRRSLQIRPNDVATAQELIDLLTGLGRGDEALIVARDAERFGRGSFDFLRRLWYLESEFGDRAVALRGLEAMLVREPDLVWANAMLAGLYMDTGRMPDARSLLDRIRASDDSLGLLTLDARWYADQGDLEGARQVFIKHISTLPAESKTEAFIAMASFMVQRQQYSLATAALESGRTSQPAATMDCDRMLGDVLTMAQRVAEGIDAYKRVVDGHADDEQQTFRKRMVENLIRLERYDEAQQNLDAMASLGAGDRNILLLRAELAKSRGNAQDAARILDEAVRLFPEDAVVYFQRAELLQEDESRLQDALADYDSAIRKSPMFWQALRNRSGVYRRLGRIDEAVADLRTATVAAGNDVDSVTQLLNELMNLRRTQEAVTAADAALAQRSTDVVFMMRVGSIFAARGEWGAAAKYHKMAFDIRKDVDVAQRYLDCLLSQNPPQLRLAEDVINAMGAQVVDNAGLLAASVAINARRARLAEAQRDATLAFDKVSSDPNRLGIWHQMMQRAFNDQNAYMAFLRQLAAQKQATALRDWPVLFLGMTQVQDPSLVQTGLELLNRLATGGQPVEVRLTALRTIGTTYYAQNQYSQAADLWTTALAQFPDDWELNNNLAYALTENLNRPGDALPYALKAVERQPQSPSVNDTVGWTYFKNGDPDKAMSYLLRAARLSRDAGEQCATVMHIVEVEVSRGNKTAAERWLTYYRRVVAESPWLNTEQMNLRAQEAQTKIDSLG